MTNTTTQDQPVHNNGTTTLRPHELDTVIDSWSDFGACLTYTSDHELSIGNEHRTVSLGFCPPATMRHAWARLSA